MVTEKHLPELKFEAARSAIAGLEKKMLKEKLNLLVDSQENYASRKIANYDYYIEKLENYFGKSGSYYLYEHIARMCEDRGDYFKASKYYYYSLMSKRLAAKHYLDAIEKKYL